ncbi:glycoside hydrolase family 97 protein [Siphonobacter aquaeclarae]|uniref:Alpha-glucosidase n=1 Tax=Siphonobacter aquaeclarae TaxID=563176 RepID=A0A1G9SQ04_9BACT|nr:glycoside hydrolase family 97 protein [Siphonobacter aquaeclarae]SDM37543.1 alpha-glucosidase [Siphonobacter aquaeclarae]
MKRYALLLLLAFPAGAQQPVLSPDGQTKWEIRPDAANSLQYRVSMGGEPVLDWSPLGIRYGQTALGQSATFRKETRQEKDESFDWRLGENDRVVNRYREAVLSYRSGTTDFQVEVRVYDGAVAFRYRLPVASARIQDELTGFRPAQTATLYQYNEETVFTPVPLAELTRTSDFPTTLTSGKFFLSVGEAGNETFTKAVLVKKEAGLGISFGKDSVTAGDITPWRTIAIAPSAVALTRFSDLSLRLTRPGAVPAWVKPGKLIRSSLTTQAGLDCIDFARKHHFQYIMYDAGWYGPEFKPSSDPTRPIPALDLAKVIAYGKEKGIGVILYVNRIALRARLDELLPLYRSWGVAGLKFGFVDGLSQEGLSWLSGAMKKVYDHGFVLNIHDNYKPTGLSHTWPNLLSQEGIRGNENNPDAFHNTVLPFTRFLAGAADYTFCYPNSNRFFNQGLSTLKLQVSKGQQLALSVIYFSPLQSIFWYGNPNDYTEEQEIEFFAAVPTVWNESRCLSGEIGHHITTARRSGRDWYMGTVTGLNDHRETLTLSFLEDEAEYDLVTYEDAPDAGIRKTVRTARKGDSLSIELKAKTGKAFIFRKR